MLFILYFIYFSLYSELISKFQCNFCALRFSVCNLNEISIFLFYTIFNYQACHSNALCGEWMMTIIIIFI